MAFGSWFFRTIIGVSSGDTSPGGAANAYLLEDGSGGYQLEDGSGVYLMEA